MTAQSFTNAKSVQSGMLLYIAAMLLFPVGDAVTKLLTIDLHPFEIGLWRYCIQTILLFGCVVAMRQSFKPSNIWLLAFSGFASTITLSTLITAFAIMPLATVIAIFFVEPLILTLLSALILGEPTGWRRYAAVCVGLVGAIIVVRPNFSLFGPAAFLPLVTACSFAANAIALRRLSATMSAAPTQFWSSTFATIFIATGMLILSHLGWVDLKANVISPLQWAMIAIAAVIAMSAFLLISSALKRAPASTIAPFQYAQIIGSVILGYIVFGDFPDALTWLGTAIILASGLYVFHRERRHPQTVRLSVPRGKSI